MTHSRTILDYGRSTMAWLAIMCMASLYAQPVDKGHLLSFPVGSQFEQRVPRDLMRDDEGILWILYTNELSYMVDEGVYRYEGFGDKELRLLDFVKGDDQGVLVSSRNSVARIRSPLHHPEVHDLSAITGPGKSMVIQEVDYDENGDLIVLVGSQEYKKLWSYDPIDKEYTLLQDSAGHVWDIHVAKDKLLLMGKTLRYLWRESEGTRFEELPSEHLLDSLDTRMDIAYADGDKVYIYTNGGKALCHDMSTQETYILPFDELISDLFPGINGPSALSMDGKILEMGPHAGTSIYHSLNQVLSSRPGIELRDGSRVFPDQERDLWLTSKEGLHLWTERSPGFELTATPALGRVTNVHVDAARDKRYVLSASTGINIFRNSTGELLTQIKEGPRGRKIEAYKCRFLNGGMYVYSLNGLMILDLDTDTVEFLVDPFLVNGKKLNNRLNTLEVNRKHDLIFLGTKENNLISFDPNTSKERSVPIIEDREPGQGNLIYEIDILPDGNLLALGSQGIFHVTVPDLRVSFASTHWTCVPALAHDEYSGIKVVAGKKLILSTFGQGLFIVDLEKDSLYRPDHNVFNDANISDIFWDEQDYVYCPSKDGLLSYHIPTNTLRLLDLRSVYPKKDLHYRYMYCDSPGEMYLGLVDAFVHFRSSEVNATSHKNSFLRSIEVNGVPQLFDPEAENSESLTLDYTQNFLSIEMSSPIDPGSSESVILYRLNGLHDDWRVHMSDADIRYEALPPGEYELEVKNINDDNAKTFLRADIIPPVWRQNWFILLALAIIAAIIFGVYRIKSGYIRKEVELREEYKLEMAQLEMKSLRAQMNPHFLFNSLNSIKSFIAQNEPRIATRYLTKFSHLIRLILNNSRESQVSLDQELKALELYIELEQLRFEHSFDYQITLDQALNTEHVMLPPLIIQPYVENAIWHGLLHKEGDRKLTIEIEKVPNGMEATIRDNGIGREAAKENRSKTATKHKSLGMAITADRISKVHEGLTSDGVIIHDLVGPDGEPLGTEVKIHLPTIND